ncbi:MAG: Fe3+-siderophores ABC transporter protein [Bdellovibrionales bacterium]|nr:Fe3+-siderophores ABC transporter protein [Bdellovibrionales bacterium]
MRVVSLVPSWTETLIHWGIPIVGRTRYCIHPKNQLESIAVVGGTKDNHWKKIEELEPDLIVADKEENRQEILEKTDVPLHVTHVEDLKSMPVELERFLEIFKNSPESVLNQITEDKKRWQSVLAHKYSFTPETLPGIIHWIHKPEQKIEKILYVIWKNPWMAVGKNTYIGSVLSHLGLESWLYDFEEKYPEIDLMDYADGKTLLLFSSEPYLFGKTEEISEIAKLKAPSAIINGESFSWFGERSLSFLESTQSI